MSIKCDHFALIIWVKLTKTAWKSSLCAQKHSQRLADFLWNLCSLATSCLSSDGNPASSDLLTSGGLSPPSSRRSGSECPVCRLQAADHWSRPDLGRGQIRASLYLQWSLSGRWPAWFAWGCRGFLGLGTLVYCYLFTWR